MTNQVVTWKKIAEKANEMYPKSLRPPLDQRAVDTGPIEYIASACMKKGTLLTNTSSPLKSKQDTILNASGISAKLNLHSRIENALTSAVQRKKKKLGIKPTHIFEDYNMSKGQIDISEIVLDKDDLRRHDLMLRR